MNFNIANGPYRSVAGPDPIRIGQKRASGNYTIWSAIAAQWKETPPFEEVAAAGADAVRKRHAVFGE